ncbi:MAG: hypothetical protein ACYCSP_11755, partial [Acidobacteriaceae bacterium]
VLFTLFLTHVGHMSNVKSNQRRFAPILAHITGISGPLHRNTQMHQTHDSPLGEAIPKTPLGAVDLTKTYVRLSHHSGEQTLCL